MVHLSSCQNRLLCHSCTGDAHPAVRGHPLATRSLPSKSLVLMSYTQPKDLAACCVMGHDSWLRVSVTLTVSCLQGWTALQTASKEGSKEVVIELLRRCADACIRDNKVRMAASRCTDSLDNMLMHNCNAHGAVPLHILVHAYALDCHTSSGVLESSMAQQLLLTLFWHVLQLSYDITLPTLAAGRHSIAPCCVAWPLRNHCGIGVVRGRHVCCQL